MEWRIAMAEKQLRKSEITKSKILRAAEAEFSEKGIWGARIDAIAESAGINKRMIYEHYISKEELYKTVLKEVYGRLAECEREFFAKDLSPEAALRNVVHVYFAFLEKNPSFVRILMWENLNNARYIDAVDPATLKNPAIEYIVAQIKRGKDKGVFRYDADEYQLTLSLLNFEFSYFVNIHTMSYVLKTELSEASEISKRADFISDMIIKYLCV